MARRLAFVVFPLLSIHCGGEGPPPVVTVPPPPTVTVEPAPPPPPPEPVPVAAPAAPSSAAEEVLREWAKTTQCTSYDYHPQGGLQSFWCHRPVKLTLAFIESKVGESIFKSGPHTHGDLKLDAANEFGHYNPNFVHWLVTNGAPSGRDSVARATTQPAYDRHLKPLAEIFYYTLMKTKAAPDCFANEKKLYGDLIAKGRLPKDYYERWFYFMNPFFCEKAKTSLGQDYFSDNGFDGGIDGNITKSVIGFWLRRSLDGTIDMFADGLQKLLVSYEPLLVAKPYRPADGAAINAAIAKAMKAASQCTGKHHVSIRIQTDGSMTGSSGRARGPIDPNAKCIEAAFSGKVPAFDGGEMKFSRTALGK